MLAYRTCLVQAKRNVETSSVFPRARWAPSCGHNRPSAQYSQFSVRPSTYWSSQRRRRLKIGLLSYAFLCACCITIDRDPAPHRSRRVYLAVPESIEHFVSPVIRRSQESRLSIRRAPNTDPYRQTLQRIMAQLQPWPSRNAYSWEAVIIEDPRRLHAWCGHNGAIYISSGLLQFCQSEDELAAVLSHELAHGVTRHRWEVSANMAIYLPLTPLVGMINALGLAALYGLHLVRNFELEADRMGVQLMAEAGYDPAAALRSLARIEGLAGLSKQAPTLFKRFSDLASLRTHPPISERLAKLQELLPSAMGIYEDRTKNASRSGSAP